MQTIEEALMLFHPLNYYICIGKIDGYVSEKSSSWLEPFKNNVLRISLRIKLFCCDSQ